ncbi:hypothetical protein MKX03_037813 [Papaver bracteatum]|nr:hypothetical protein MKX03_037813 [Papaver bracteatum]
MFFSQLFRLLCLVLLLSQVSFGRVLPPHQGRGRFEDNPRPGPPTRPGHPSPNP